jgi:hypothetical protein
LRKRLLNQKEASQKPKLAVEEEKIDIALLLTAPLIRGLF